MADDAVLLLLPGAIFHERYRVVRRIKAGGMGAVYEVVDDRTNSPRALKVMLPSVLGDADLRARFALEAKVTGNIVSDHLVRVSDAGIDPPTGTPFLVMELLQGEELGSLAEKRGPMPAGEVVLYLHQAALALDKTHAAGIVHRDLKPENLFVTRRDDGSPCVKILDFGIAKVVAEGTAHATRPLGTPIYMSPEQVRGLASIGPRTDLLALGHIAYTLLVGEPYWQKDLAGADSLFPLLQKIVEGIRDAPSARAQRRRGVTLPPAFDAWMVKAAAPLPDDRFDRATVQVAALAEALGVAGPRAAFPSLGEAPVSIGGGGSVRPPGSGSGPQAAASGVAVTSAPIAPPRRPVLPVAVGMAVVAGLLMVGVLALRSRSAATGAPSASAAVAVTPPPASETSSPPVAASADADAGPGSTPTVAAVEPVATATRPAAAAKPPAATTHATGHSPAPTAKPPKAAYDPSKEM